MTLPSCCLATLLSLTQTNKYIIHLNENLLYNVTSQNWAVYF